ncbi:MAG: hypothetical protein KDB26_10570 [Microthrixaceae bacterium]|nr:hypothetical protein [Microthrixaceae bacterium]
MKRLSGKAGKSTARRPSTALGSTSWSLYLDFCGDERQVPSTDTVSFGRCGDLVIDDNPYMHRVVGRFRHSDGIWWLENHSKRQVLEVRDCSGPSMMTIAPGLSCAVLMGDFTVSFAAGPTTYQVSGSLESFEWDLDLLGEGGIESTETLDWGRVELNEDQRRLLLVLTEQYLLNPGQLDAPMVSNRMAAQRLGWPITKFNRKLDHLCEKVQRAGVPGLHGELGGNAMDRRRRLVQHALTVPLVTVDDLSSSGDLNEEPDSGPVSAAEVEGVGL